MTTQNDHETSPSVTGMPAIFAAHGAPILLDDAAWMGELAAWAKAMPKPKSVLMVSAHWEERPTSLGSTRPVPLVYEHYAPVLVAAGAAADERPTTTFPITGWWMDGAFTKRSVQFG